ncbi:hypothetical protein E1B42_13725 [Salmonella enterica subsp. enterica serovar Agona]|uniref:Uncharacterized protein n=3 Tax=Salmonella enterica TaxID=28901 RepID=A0A4U7PND9_SALET|nr:hypothetical protein [Salmonella enterica subsp. enterica serovar Tennessee]EAA3401212.1 hypothetical protein [Salmonella enterica]EAA7371570.1 hypothetical protein [Salmonella enterica subsp. enterica]EAA7426771.1 hypothetical protein [Salmonella enterica subsp. enterica serovar Newport]EAA7583835.1 hypothetical protein [Salmonella enterica subsp. enterica serovar Agona]EAA9852702.1 hypothetical protein [Salmonella enterica subsp. enterica serovar Paratyphi B str. SARA61]EAN2519781.1 hypo
MPDGAALIRPTVLQLPHTQRSPSVRTGFFTCLMPATLRAVAAQRSNPLPADFSSSGECSPTDHR